MEPTTLAETTTTETQDTVTVRPTLAPTPLENNRAYVAGLTVPAGFQPFYVLLTTIRGGIEHRAAAKYAERSIDLTGFDVRLFIERGTVRPVYDEIDRTANELAGKLDYARGLVSYPAILAGAQVGAFPGLVKLAGPERFISTDEYNARRDRKRAASLAVGATTTEPVTEPALTVIIDPATVPATETVSAELADDGSRFIKSGRRYIPVTDETDATEPRFRRISTVGKPNRYLPVATVTETERTETGDEREPV